MPEISIKKFSRAWTCCELVAVAKEWDEDKQLAIILTFLRGRLVDYYVDLKEEERATAKDL